MGGRLGTPIERFWRHITVHPRNRCWVWLASDDGKRYGQINLGKNRIVKAYKFAYSHFVGDVPNGLEIDHICRNTLCCNPDHLRAVTKQMNLENMERPKGGEHYQAKKTHCPKGHPYFGNNLYLKPGNGHRGCKECRRKWRAKKIEV